MKVLFSSLVSPALVASIVNSSFNDTMPLKNINPFPGSELSLDIMYTSESNKG